MPASINAGHEHGVAQAQHGSAPDIAGQGVANPTSLIRSAAWASWNSKGLIKPLLGPSYGRVADWFIARKALG